MTFRIFVHVVIAIALLGANRAQAQNTARPAKADLPDACKLMPESDIAARFPGMPIKTLKPTLSPIPQGPQYNQACTYSVDLPSPTSKSSLGSLVSFWIQQCDACDAFKIAAARQFAANRKSTQQVAATLHEHFKLLSNVADEAFEVTSGTTPGSPVNIYARKDDLIYWIQLEYYSQQTEPNALALATQVAKRWRGGRMIAAATPITPSRAVEIPPDTREFAEAPPDEWPDACALLTPQDVRAIFGDMTIGPQQKKMGELRMASRVDRVERLPHPMVCGYTANKTTMANGERKYIYNSITLGVNDVAPTLDLAKRRYQIAAKGNTPVPGLGDEACIDAYNSIYIRKGFTNIMLHVSADLRDRTLYDDARRRLNQLAKRVAERLP